MLPEILLHDHFRVSEGMLYVGGISASDLVREYGTPLYVTSADRVVENYRNLVGAFRGKHTELRVKYAVKANSNPHIISLLAGEGSGADVSNLLEYRIARKSGIPLENIIMSPNNLPAEELAEASHEGVTINFDDIGQMESIVDTLPGTLSFRINPGVGRGEFPGTVTAGPEAKFGLPAEIAMKGYRKAKENGVKRFGIQIMTGSNVLDPDYFGSITRNLLDTVKTIGKGAGITFDFIDIGGGLGVPYRPGEKVLDLNKVAAQVSDAFRKAFPDSSNVPTLFMEPGRYLVADSTVLLGRVTNVKSYGKTFIGTDVGMNVMLRPALYGAYHPVALANRMDASPSITADVVGQICENTDKIAERRDLPEPRVGDIIAVFNTGAYGFVMSTQYNGHGRPAEVLVRSGKAELIRRREGLDDILSTVV